MIVKEHWLKRNWKWFVPLIIVVFVVPVGFHVASDREDKELNETTRAQLGGTYITLSDGVTHYELAGPQNGPVVVLVHGGTVPMWVWDSQVEPLTSDGFRVLRYDMFARGYSDRPEVEYNRQLYRKQLLSLLDTLGLKEPVDLVGLSFGGAVIADFTANHPERVRRLVLCAPLVTFEETGLNATFQKLLRIPFVGNFLLRTLVIQSYIDRAGSLFEGSDMAGRYNELFREQLTFEGSERAVLSMVRGDALGDYRQVYEAVGKQYKKTMLVWGTADEEISREMMDEVRKFIPQVQFHALDGVSHALNLEATEEFNEFLIDFLK